MKLAEAVIFTFGADVWVYGYKHTHTHTFNGPLSRTTWVSQYQKGKTNLDFTEARDSEWQYNPLGQMQVCTSLQTDNHASTPPLSFLQAGCPSCHPTNSVKALKAIMALWLQKSVEIRHCANISDPKATCVCPGSLIIIALNLLFRGCGFDSCLFHIQVAIWGKFLCVMGYVYSVLASRMLCHLKDASCRIYTMMQVMMMMVMIKWLYVIISPAMASWHPSFVTRLL